MVDSKLQQIIAEALELSLEAITSEASTDTVEKWDSLGHLKVVLAVEDAFAVKFHTAEIPDLVSIVQLEQALRQRNAL
jgi:acyl carrier protein